MAAMTLPMVPPAFGVRQIRPSRTPRIIGGGYDPDLTPVQPEWIVAGRTRDDAEVHPVEGRACSRFDSRRGVESTRSRSTQGEGRVESVKGADPGQTRKEHSDEGHGSGQGDGAVRGR